MLVHRDKKIIIDVSKYSSFASSLKYPFLLLHI